MRDAVAETNRLDWSYDVVDVREAFNSQVFVNSSFEKIETVEDGLRLYAFFQHVNAVVHAVPVEKESRWDCAVWVLPDGVKDEESAYLYLSVMMTSFPPTFSKSYRVENMRRMADEDTYWGGLTEDLSSAEITLSFLWRLLEHSRAAYNTMEMTERADDLTFLHYCDGAEPSTVSGRWHGYSVFVRFRKGTAVLSVGLRESEALWDASMDFGADEVPWDDDDEGVEKLQSLRGVFDLNRQLTVDEFSALFPALVRRLDMSVLLWIFTFNEQYPLITTGGASKDERQVGIMAHTRAEAEETFLAGHGDIPFSCMTENMGEDRPAVMPAFQLRPYGADVK